MPAMGTVLWVPPRCLFPDTAVPIPPPPGAAPTGTCRFPWESSQWEREMNSSASPQPKKTSASQASSLPRLLGDIASKGECVATVPGDSRWLQALPLSPSPWLHLPGNVTGFTAPGCSRLQLSRPTGQTPSVPHPGGQQAWGQQISPCTRAQLKPLSLQALPRGSHGETEAWQKATRPQTADGTTLGWELSAGLSSQEMGG